MKNIRCADCGNLKFSDRMGVVECQAPLPFYADEGAPKNLSAFEIVELRTCDAFEKSPEVPTNG